MPRLSQTGGEEWRMQPSILHMRTMFLLAVWWSHRWSTHIGKYCWSQLWAIHTKDEVKQLERAKNDLWRYTHYHDRYKAHTDSLEAEVQLKEKLQMKVSTLEAMEKESKDLSWVTNGLYRLFRSRRFLSYSYPFACHMFGDDLENDMTKKETEIKKNLSEDQQQQLEASMEKLSMSLEEPFHGYAEDKVRETRMKIIALSKITDDFCKKLYECTENDLLGPLQ